MDLTDLPYLTVRLRTDGGFSISRVHNLCLDQLARVAFQAQYARSGEPCVLIVLKWPSDVGAMQWSTFPDRPKCIIPRAWRCIPCVRFTRSCDSTVLIASPENTLCEAVAMMVVLIITVDCRERLRRPQEQDSQCSQSGQAKDQCRRRRIATKECSVPSLWSRIAASTTVHLRSVSTLM